MLKERERYVMVLGKYGDRYSIFQGSMLIFKYSCVSARGSVLVSVSLALKLLMENYIIVPNDLLLIKMEF